VIARGPSRTIEQPSLVESHGLERNVGGATDFRQPPRPLRTGKGYWLGVWDWVPCRDPAADRGGSGRMRFGYGRLGESDRWVGGQRPIIALTFGDASLSASPFGAAPRGRHAMWWR
jgi:hypothetical protein